MNLLGVESRIFSTDLPGPPAARQLSSVSSEELPAAASSVCTTLAPVRWPRRFAYAPTLRHALAETAPWAHLIVIHSLFLYPQYVAWRAASRCHTPYIVAAHGALDPYLRRRGRLRKAVTDALWQERMLAGAIALQFATEDEAALASDIVPAVRRIIVPLGIDTSTFATLPSSARFRATYLGGHEGPVVLALGRLARKKGLDILVRAFSHVSELHPEAILVLAGPDDEGLEPTLRALARDLGVARRVIFTGMLFHEQRLEALAAATVWALPSHTENFGIAAMEALAAGVPTVVSPAVNLAPRLREHEAAIISDATPEAFAAAIDELLSKPARRERLSSAGRAFAQRYDWALVAAETKRIYDDILKTSASGGSRASDQPE